MKPRLITLLAGLSLMIPATFASLGVPTLLTPLPGVVVISTFLLGVPAVFVPSLLFFAWHPALFKGSAKFPKRTYGLFSLLVVLTVVWFIISWKWGVQFQGAKYTIVACVINVVWIFGLGVVLWRYRSQASFNSNLAIHWVIFLWLSWWAFPYLGELP
jgi:hypothetical protein